MGQMVKMTVKEAADKLLEKGAISSEECELLKEAAAGQTLSAAGKFLKDVAAPTAGAIGMFGLGVGALQQLLTPVVNKVQSQIAFNKMTKKVPILQEKDPDQVKDYFKVVETFSPKAATNPLVAGAIVNKMIEFGGVDHKLVQDISSIQNALPMTTGLQDLSGAAAKSVMSGGDGPKTMNVNLKTESYDGL